MCKTLHIFGKKMSNNLSPTLKGKAASKAIQ